MQRFDTTGTIKAYAENPDSDECFLRFYLLKSVTDASFRWEAIKQFGIEDANSMRNLVLWAFKDEPGKQERTEKHVLTVEELAGMPKAERDKLFLDLCAGAGLAIDPKTLMNAGTTDPDARVG